MVTFTLGSNVPIILGGAATVNAVAVRMAHGKVASTTEKAVRVEFDDRSSVWIPRRALQPSGESFRLARWFLKAMSYGDWRKLERVADVSGVTA